MNDKEDSFSNRMKGYVKMCDVLVKPYEFKVMDREKNVTVLGGSISIFIAVFATLYFIAVFIRTY